MSLRLANGNVISKATVYSTYVTETTPDENKTYRVLNTSLFEGVTYDGESTFEGHRRKALISGQTYTKGQIDLYFPTATVEKVTTDLAGLVLATALATAGGTVVYVHGDNFSGASGVTFGGSAGTSFSVTNNKLITVTTPAKTAAAYDVVVADDSGNITLDDGVTYA